jgi:hypothetical protein
VQCGRNQGQARPGQARQGSLEHIERLEYGKGQLRPGVEQLPEKRQSGGSSVTSTC